MAGNKEISLDLFKASFVEIAFAVSILLDVISDVISDILFDASTIDRSFALFSNATEFVVIAACSNCFNVTGFVNWLSGLVAIIFEAIS
jgi:hypothetical protein